MLRTKYHLIFLLCIIWVSACIEPYEPEIKSGVSKKYVVSGGVTDKEGYQYVNISLASKISEPDFIPLNSCDVFIIDELGNSFQMEEFEEGRYRVWMSQENLIPGIAYQLNIRTPAGVDIVSNSDTMPTCPDIENLYYKIESKLTNDPDKPLIGIQFYIDVNAYDTKSFYYRWELEETWEYRTKFPITRYYDGEHHLIHPPDYSRNVCWKTERIENIYTLSLGNASQSNYKMLPLHFVDNKTDRLAQRYSVLVNQIAISEAAYIFWEQLSKNSSSQGGLYGKQPISVKGNLYSPSNSKFEVLGFFGTMSIKEKRVFVENLDIEFDYPEKCISTNLLEFKSFEDLDPISYPVYYYIEDNEVIAVVDQCFDCLTLGGYNIKPDYWPE